MGHCGIFPDKKNSKIWIKLSRLFTKKTKTIIRIDNGTKNQVYRYANE